MMASRKLTEEEEDEEEEEDIVVNPHLLPEMTKRLLFGESDHESFREAIVFVDLFYKQNEGSTEDECKEEFVKLTTEILPKIFAFWQKYKDSDIGSVEKEFSLVALSAMNSAMRISIPNHGCSLFINTVNFFVLEQLTIKNSITY